MIRAANDDAPCTTGAADDGDEASLTRVMAWILVELASDDVDPEPLAMDLSLVRARIDAMRPAPHPTLRVVGHP